MCRYCQIRQSAMTASAPETDLPDPSARQHLYPTFPRTGLRTDPERERNQLQGVGHRSIETANVAVNTDAETGPGAHRFAIDGLVFRGRRVPSSVASVSSPHPRSGLRSRRGGSTTEENFVLHEVVDVDRPTPRVGRLTPSGKSKFFLSSNLLAKTEQSSLPAGARLRLG